MVTTFLMGFARSSDPTEAAIAGELRAATSNIVFLTKGMGVMTPKLDRGLKLTGWQDGP
jgi:hypothetical protein